MAAVSLGVDSDHIGDVRTLDVGPVEHLLANVVEFVGENAPLDAEGIVGLLSDNSVGHLGKPPNAYIFASLPFLYHWFLTANSERLIGLRFKI